MMATKNQKIKVQEDKIGKVGKTKFGLRYKEKKKRILSYIRLLRSMRENGHCMKLK